MKRVFNIAFLPLLFAAAIGFLCSWPGGAAVKKPAEPKVAAEAVIPTEAPKTENTDILPALESVYEPEEESKYYAPEVSEYYEDVEAGRVRYVSQLNEPENSGWGKYSWKAGQECTTACISMALSFLGIDESPEALLDYSSKTYLCSCYGLDDEYPIEVSPINTPVIPEGEAKALFDKMMESYLTSEPGKVSPVVLYVSGNGNRHCILIIGVDEEDYLALDPANSGIHRFNISEDGKVTTPEREYFYRYTAGGDADVLISSLGQWQLHAADAAGKGE